MAKMIVLRQCMIYLLRIGVFYKRDQNASSLRDVLFGILYLIPMANLMATSIAYFMAHISNISQATEASNLFLGLLLYFAQYLTFFGQRIETRAILYHLQNIVDKSEPKRNTILVILN